jgi:phospholipid transport system substrate-binding protein
MTRRTLLSATLALLVTLASLSVARPARAGEPTEQLKVDIARVLEALKHPARREAVHAVSRNLFDWTEMARRSLGGQWQELTERGREEFAELLGRHVDGRLIALADYAGDAIAYTGETLEGDSALVETTIAMAHGRGLSLDYRMRRAAGRWLIYDVALDGRSMVASYRAQFARVIKTASYGALFEKLAPQ